MPEYTEEIIDNSEDSHLSIAHLARNGDYWNEGNVYKKPKNFKGVWPGGKYHELVNNYWNQTDLRHVWEINFSGAVAKGRIQFFK